MSESTDSGKQTLKALLSELEIQDFSPDRAKPAVPPQLAERIGEITKSLFSGTDIPDYVETELKMGFGHALGYRVMDLLWEDLESEFKSGTNQERAGLTLSVPPEMLKQARLIVPRASSHVYRITGVQIPRVFFQSGPDIELRWRQLTLLSWETIPDGVDFEDRLVDVITKNSWKLLSSQQIAEQLRGLWRERPELQRAAIQNNIGLISCLRVLRAILKEGWPIHEFDHIVENIISTKAAPLSDMAQETREELLEPLGESFIIRTIVPEPASSPSIRDHLRSRNPIELISIVLLLLVYSLMLVK